MVADNVCIIHTILKITMISLITNNYNIKVKIAIQKKITVKYSYFAYGTEILLS